MTEQENKEEKRQHKRVKTMKRVKAVISYDELDALLHDISGGGAALGVDYVAYPDDSIEVNIESVGLIRGKVVRPINAGLAVRFIDIDMEREKSLLSLVDRLAEENEA